MTVDQLQAAIKTASTKMRADDNTKGALAYLEQLTWLLFLKVLDELEEERELRSQVDGSDFAPVLDEQYRWRSWVHESTRTGDELTTFVNEKLLPHLREIRGSSRSNQISRLFESVSVVMKSGHALREVLSIVDGIDFHELQNAHAMSVLYETLLSQTSDAGWSGEFYTPRPIVEFMVDLCQPQLGQTVYDPCAGSAGFLVVAHDRLRSQATTTEQYDHLHSETFFGSEAGELAFLVGTMNLMLHGVDDPQTIRQNTLEQDVRSIPDSAKHDLILTNPPFGGTENPQVQQNFPARSAATELLFLQHCMAKLKQDGVCSVVLPDGVLYRAESAFSTVRRRLLKEFSVLSIVRLPTGVFPNAPDTRTNLLTFARRPSDDPHPIRYYQIHPPAGKRSYSKTNPLLPGMLNGARAWLIDGVRDENSWELTLEEAEARGFDLDIPWPGSADTDDGSDAPAKLEAFLSKVSSLGDIAQELVSLSDSLNELETSGRQEIRRWIRETGFRSGRSVEGPFVGVSNAGGLGAFKGKPASDTSRYRRVDVGDFVYNPMRADVGSIAYCRTPEEAGWVSPDYVVFTLNDDCPFSADYLLTFMKSKTGKAEITLKSRGAVRRRLYYDCLERLEVPLPRAPESWEAAINALVSARRQARELSGAAEGGVTSLEAALFNRPDDEMPS